MQAMITGGSRGPTAPDAPLDEFKYEPMTPPDGMAWEDVGALAEKILFCVPHRASEGISGGICDNFGDWGRWGLRVCRIKDPHGGFIEAVRGGIVRIFLKYAKMSPELKFLVMCDNDQQIEKFAPISLARWDKPVTSGVVCGFTDEKGVFACFTIKGKDGAAYFPSAKGTRVMPAKGLVEAHQVGTGLICIRKDVLETFDAAGEFPFTIPEPIRRQASLTGDLRKSEDICFSDLCETYGFKRYVDLSVHAIHYKNVGLSWMAGGTIDENLAAEDWDVTLGVKAAPDKDDEHD